MNNLNELRDDCALKQKKGIHFIMASVIIWAGITAVHLSPMDIMDKNLFTFCLSAPLMPIAYAVSKILKIDFQNKSNPLTPLGILFSVNQIVYLPIAMWVYNVVPEKMLMVYAMIFGAHLMPYSWLYRSPSYMVLSVLVPIFALILGLSFPPYVLAAGMLVVEVLFVLLLAIEMYRTFYKMGLVEFAKTMSQEKPRFMFNTIGLFTTDNARMVAFYRDLFGFETEWNGSDPNVEMTLGTSRIILFPRAAFEQMTSQQYAYPHGTNGTMELSFDVPSFADVDEEYERAVSRGAKPVFAPTTEPWGQRTCYVADPEGNLIEISSFNSFLG